MNEFKASTINEVQELFAKELKTARLAKEISIEQVAKDTGINKRYIAAMETGNFQFLPQGIYKKKIIKEYAGFLNLEGKIEPILNELLSEAKDKKNSDPFYRQALKKVYFLTIPKLFKGLIILFVVFACFLYLGFYLNKITSLPYLEINNPAKDSTTTETLLIVRGRTDPTAEITINNEAILKNSDGSFQKKLFLKVGLNTISVSAQKKYSQAKTAIRKIIVLPKQQNID